MRRMMVSLGLLAGLILAPGCDAKKPDSSTPGGANSSPAGKFESPRAKTDR